MSILSAMSLRLYEFEIKMDENFFLTVDTRFKQNRNYRFMTEVHAQLVIIDVILMNIGLQFA